MLDINQFVDIEETRRRNRAENSDYKSPSESETDDASDADENGNLAGFVVSDYDSEEEKSEARRYCRRQARLEAKRLGGSKKADTRKKDASTTPIPAKVVAEMASRSPVSEVRRTATEEETAENLKEFDELMGDISDLEERVESHSPPQRQKAETSDDNPSNSPPPDRSTRTPLALPVTAMRPRWGFAKASLGLNYLRKGYRGGRGARARMLREAVARGKKTRAENRAMDKHIDSVLESSGRPEADDHQNDETTEGGRDGSSRAREPQSNKVMTAEERAADREKKRAEREEALRIAKEVANKEKESRCKEFDIPIAILLRKRLRGRFNTRPRHTGEVSRDAIRLAMGVRSRRELYIVRKVIRRVLAHHNVSLLTCWGKQDTEKIARVCNQVVRIFRKNNPNWNLGMARVAVQHTLEDSGKTIRRKAKGYKSQPISYSRSAPRPKKYAPDFSEHLVESEKEEEEASMIPEPNNGMGDTAVHRDRQRAASSAISHASKQTTNQRGTDRTGQNGAPTEKSGAEKVSRQNHESGRVSSSPARVDPLPQTPGNRFSGRSAALSTPSRQAPAAPTPVKTPVGSAPTSNHGLMGPPPTPHRQIVKTVKSVAPVLSTQATPAASTRNSYFETPLRAESSHGLAQGATPAYRPPLVASLRVEYITSFQDYTSRASFVMTLYKKHTLRTFVISIEKMIGENLDLACIFFLYKPIAGDDPTWYLLRDVAAIAQMFTIQGPQSGVYMCHADYDTLNATFLKNALDEFSLYSYFRAVKAEARTNVPLFEGGTYTVDELHAAQFMVVVDSDNADPTDHVKVFESTGKILHEYVRSYRWQLLDEKDEDSEEGEDANLDQIIERERASDPIILSSSISRRDTALSGRSSYPPKIGSARASVAPIPTATTTQRSGSRASHLSASRLPTVSVSRAASRANSTITGSRTGSFAHVDTAKANLSHPVRQPTKSTESVSVMSPVKTPRQTRQMLIPPDTFQALRIPTEVGDINQYEGISQFDPSAAYRFQAPRTSPLASLEDMKQRNTAAVARANGLDIPPDGPAAVHDESVIAAEAREELRIELEKRFGNDVDINKLSPKQWEIFRKLVSQKKRQIRKRKAAMEAERLRQEQLRRDEEEAELRRQENLRRHQEEALRRKQEEDEAERRRQEHLRAQFEKAQRRKREEEMRLKEEEARQRRLKEEARLKEEEERARQEEEARLKEEEEERARQEKIRWQLRVRRQEEEERRRKEEEERFRLAGEEELRRQEEEERIRREKEEEEDRRQKQRIAESTARATARARAEREQLQRQRDAELAAQRQQELEQQRADEEKELRRQEQAEQDRRRRQEETIRRRKEEEEALRLQRHRDQLDEALKSLQEEAENETSDDGQNSLFNESDAEDTLDIRVKSSALKVPVPKTYDTDEELYEDEEFYDDMPKGPLRPWRNPVLNLNTSPGVSADPPNSKGDTKTGWPADAIHSLDQLLNSLNEPANFVPDSTMDYPDFAPPTQLSQLPKPGSTARPASPVPTVKKKRTLIVLPSPSRPGYHLTVKDEELESEEEQEPRRPSKRPNLRASVQLDNQQIPTSIHGEVISLLTSPQNTQPSNPAAAAPGPPQTHNPVPARPARHNTRSHTRHATNMGTGEEPNVWWIRTPAELEFAGKMLDQNFPTKDDIRELVGFPIDRRKNTDKHRHALQAIDSKLKTLSYAEQKTFDWLQFVWEETKDMPETKAYQRSDYPIVNPALSRVRSSTLNNANANDPQQTQQPPPRAPQQSQQQSGSHPNPARPAGSASQRRRPPSLKDTPPPAPRKRGATRRNTLQAPNQPTSDFIEVKPR